MQQVTLDTSFLISFADPNRANHAVAVDYFRHCLAKQIPMNVSVIAAGEFEVGQPVSDLPLQNFRLQPFNLAHAVRAASYFRALKQGIIATDSNDRRPVIVNDLNIIAQAEEDGVSVLLTEDASTMSWFAERLRKAGLSQVEVILLSEGFTPGRLDNPNQTELRLGSTDATPQDAANEI